MIKQVFNSASSASFELDNQECYYAPESYSVYINGELAIEEETRNLFSVYGLLPGQQYQMKVKNSQMEETVSFCTDSVCVSLNVRDFYALGDGVHDDTLAVQAAILSCPTGGRVVIPEGTFLVKALFLKSDMQLEIQKGAVLLGETDRHLYPVLPGRISCEDGEEYSLGTWEGEPDDVFASMITGIYVKNIKIYGEGILDENSQNSDWWINHKVKRVARRPKGIFLNHCDNIQFQGITVKNTPSWNQHPFFSQNLSYVDMKLMSPKDSPTTDGCDPESCTNVKILGCRISVGDDCIAIKSGKAELGRKYRTPSSQITIRNCLMEFGHGGVTLGSEMSGGIKDITVAQCIFRDTDRGLRIKSRRGRGNTAVIDGITFDNIKMEHVLAPLTINMFYKAGSEAYVEEHFVRTFIPVDETTPYLGKFTFKNLAVTDAEWGAAHFLGLPEQPIGDITIENVVFHMKEDAEPGAIIMTPENDKVLKEGLYFENVNQVHLINTRVEGALTEPVVYKNVAFAEEDNKAVLKEKNEG